MANTKSTSSTVPKPLGYSEAFELLDAVDQAKTRLKGTLGLMTLVIDTDRERDEGVSATIERHFLADVAELDEACNVAWEALLTPLHAGAFSGAPFGKAVGK